MAANPAPQPSTRCSSCRAHLGAYDHQAGQLARDLARDDAAQGFDHELGIPTPSMSVMCSRLDVAGAQLADIQRDEERELAAALDRARAREAELAASTDPEDAPVRVTQRDLLGVRLLQGVVVGALAGETMLLVDPINEILGGGIGYTVEGTSGAVILTSVGAVLAHLRARAADRAASEAPGPASEAAGASANAMTIGLLAVAGAAVLARVYAAMLTDGRVDSAGVAFFVLLQLVFLLAALTLPQALTEVRQRIFQRRLDQDVADARLAVASLERDLEAMREAHSTQERQLVDLTESALWTYVVEVANQHPDPWMADDLRAWIIELRRGGHLRGLIAGAPPAPLEQQPLPPPPGDQGDPEGDPGFRAPPDPGPAGPRPAGPSHRPGSPGRAQEASPPTDHEWQGYQSPQDLLDDIVREAG